MSATMKLTLVTLKSGGTYFVQVPATVTGKATLTVEQIKALHVIMHPGTHETAPAAILPEIPR